MVNNSFGFTPTGETVTVFTAISDLLAAGSLVPDPTGTPKAYLNYLVFDLEHNPVPIDQTNLPWQNVTNAAASGTAETLSLDYTAEADGYMYIYVANETMENVDVYFDDLTISHTGISIIQSTDYYPYGLVMRETKDENYRFGYQGQFAERDSTTGWNQFEARMWDPVISRWTAVDPSRQFWSGYLGMGNNPINGVDPDGRDWFKDPDTGNPIWVSATETFSDNAGVVWEHLSSSPDFIVATHNRDYNDVIGAEPINSGSFDVYDATISYFDPVGSIMGNTVPAGQKTGEVPPSFGGRRFSTIAEEIYPARDQPRATYPNENALIINEGRPIPTTWYSPRPTAVGVFLHWGNPFRESLVSRSGRGRQFSEACLTTGSCLGTREIHDQFFEQHLSGFHEELWLRGR